ncbi:MAG: hypothetical protein ABH859_05845 [Pseudomonadota bacterium]
MHFQTVQPELIKYEMRMVQGVDPHVKEQKKPGFFGRLLSGVGKVLGAAAMPLSFIFPPAAIGAAGMYGIGQIGDMMQTKAAQKQMEQMQKQQHTNVSFPGLEIGDSQVRPAGFDLSAQDEQVMNVLFARNRSMNEMAQSI